MGILTQYCVTLTISLAQIIGRSNPPLQPAAAGSGSALAYASSLVPFRAVRTSFSDDFRWYKIRRALHTILQPQFHHIDTDGVTDHISVLCQLLGIEFMPRIKDLSDRRLFKLGRHQDYEELDCLFDETVNRDPFIEQWDQIVRLGVSLKNWLAPPEVVVERLVSATTVDRLATALTGFGRIVKTIHILRYIQDEKHRAVQLQLSRGEGATILPAGCSSLTAASSETQT